MLLLSLFFISKAFISTNGKSVNICSDDEKTLNCQNSAIQIYQASYGRHKLNACFYDGVTWFTTCQMNLTNIVSSLCTGKRECNVSINNLKFSMEDECKFEPNNYINIEYICSSDVIPTEAPKKEMVPVGEEQELTTCQYFENEVTCDSNQSLNITSVFWGRDDSTTCRSNWLSNNVMCKDDEKRLTTKFKNYCDGFSVCPVFAHEEWLGEKCKETSKYLKIKYFCTELKRTFTTATTTVPNLKTKIVCQPMSSIIFSGCEENVMFVYRATYGRQDGALCSESPGNKSNTNCATDATKILKFQCDNKHLCIAVSTSPGMYGDPCPDTHKYLKVEYYCAKPEPTTMPPAVPSVATAPAITYGTTLTPLQCGQPRVQSSRIIEGDFAKPGAWPWMVSLYSIDGEFKCGGSLLNPLWFVTAAHCFPNDDINNYYVVLGDTDRSTIDGNEVRYSLSRKILKDYDKSNNDNDLAMVQFARPVIFTNYISPVCLSIATTDVTPGKTCYLTGWGKSMYPQRYNPVNLRQSKMTITTREECKDKAAKAPGITDPTRVTDNMVCAKNEGVQSGCQGDSGGPLVCEDKGTWVLQGIASWTSARCVQSDMYTVFTRVTKYRDWIKNIMVTL